MATPAFSKLFEERKNTLGPDLASKFRPTDKALIVLHGVPEGFVVLEVN